MATYYVTHDAAGGNGSEGNPWTMAEALTNAAAGDLVWCKQNSGIGYSTIQNDTVSNSGSHVADTHIVFRAYYNTIHDMNPGEIYYGSATDGFLDYNSLTMKNINAKWFVIDGGADVNDMITYSNKSNIHWFGFRFKNCLGNIFELGTAFDSEGVTWHHCRVEALTTVDAINGRAAYTLVDDCFVHGLSCLKFDSGTGGRHCRNSVLYGNGGGSCMTFKNGSGGGSVSNCLLLNAGKGIYPQDDAGIVVVHNNTFYGITEDCVKINGGTCLVSAYNNIFSPAAIDDYAIRITDVNKGSLLYCDYNDAYSVTAGAVLTTPYYHTTDAVVPPMAVMANNNLQVNPGFADVTNFNFTPTRWQLMEYGRKDCGYNPQHLGGIGKPSVYDIIYGASA